MEEKLSLYNACVFIHRHHTHVWPIWNLSKNMSTYGFLQKIQIWENIGIWRRESKYGNS
jgi:hypothetical protein